MDFRGRGITTTARPGKARGLAQDNCAAEKCSPLPPGGLNLRGFYPVYPQKAGLVRVMATIVGGAQGHGDKL